VTTVVGRVTGPSKAATQRAAIEAIKAKRPTAPADQQDEPPSGPSRGRRAWDATKAAGTDQAGSPGWWPSNAEPVRAANTGGGFVLGVFIWVGVRAYLEGGTVGVRNLLAAKFFNKTGATT
jgi:hypothetical protein